MSSASATKGKHKKGAKTLDAIVRTVHAASGIATKFVQQIDDHTAFSGNKHDEAKASRSANASNGEERERERERAASPEEGGERKRLHGLNQISNLFNKSFKKKKHKAEGDVRTTHPEPAIEPLPGALSNTIDEAKGSIAESSPSVAAEKVEADRLSHASVASLAQSAKVASHQTADERQVEAANDAQSSSTPATSSKDQSHMLKSAKQPHQRYSDITRPLARVSQSIDEELRRSPVQSTSASSIVKPLNTACSYCAHCRSPHRDRDRDAGKLLKAPSCSHTASSYTDLVHPDDFVTLMQRTPSTSSINMSSRVAAAGKTRTFERSRKRSPTNDSEALLSILAPSRAGPAEHAREEASKATARDGERKLRVMQGHYLSASPGTSRRPHSSAYSTQRGESASASRKGNLKVSPTEHLRPSADAAQSSRPRPRPHSSVVPEEPRRHGHSDHHRKHHHGRLHQSQTTLLVAEQRVGERSVSEFSCDSISCDASPHDPMLRCVVVSFKAPDRGQRSRWIRKRTRRQAAAATASKKLKPLSEVQPIPRSHHALLSPVERDTTFSAFSDEVFTAQTFSKAKTHQKHGFEHFKPTTNATSSSAGRKDAPFYKEWVIGGKNLDAEDSSEQRYVVGPNGQRWLVHKEPEVDPASQLNDGLNSFLTISPRTESTSFDFYYQETMRRKRANNLLMIAPQSHERARRHTDWGKPLPETMPSEGAVVSRHAVLQMASSESSASISVNDAEKTVRRPTQFSNTFRKVVFISDESADPQLFRIIKPLEHLYQRVEVQITRRKKRSSSRRPNPDRPSRCTTPEASDVEMVAEEAEKPKSQFLTPTSRPTPADSGLLLHVPPRPTARQSQPLSPVDVGERPRSRADRSVTASPFRANARSPATWSLKLDKAPEDKAFRVDFVSDDEEEAEDDWCDAGPQETDADADADKVRELPLFRSNSRDPHSPKVDGFSQRLVSEAASPNSRDVHETANMAESFLQRDHLRGNRKTGDSEATADSGHESAASEQPHPDISVEVSGPNADANRDLLLWHCQPSPSVPRSIYAFLPIGDSKPQFDASFPIASPRNDASALEMEGKRSKFSSLQPIEVIVSSPNNVSKSKIRFDDYDAAIYDGKLASSGGKADNPSSPAAGVKKASVQALSPFPSQCLSSPAETSVEMLNNTGVVIAQANISAVELPASACLAIIKVQEGHEFTTLKSPNRPALLVFDAKQIYEFKKPSDEQQRDTRKPTPNKESGGGNSTIKDCISNPESLGASFKGDCSESESKPRPVDGSSDRTGGGEQRESDRSFDTPDSKQPPKSSAPQLADSDEIVYEQVRRKSHKTLAAAAEHDNSKQPSIYDESPRRDHEKGVNSSPQARKTTVDENPQSQPKARPKLFFADFQVLPEPGMETVSELVQVDLTVPQLAETSAVGDLLVPESRTPNRKEAASQASSPIARPKSADKLTQTAFDDEPFKASCDANAAATKKRASGEVVANKADSNTSNELVIFDAWLLHAEAQPLNEKLEEVEDLACKFEVTRLPQSAVTLLQPNELCVVRKHSRGNTETSMASNSGDQLLVHGPKSTIANARSYTDLSEAADELSDLFPSGQRAAAAMVTAGRRPSVRIVTDNARLHSVSPSKSPDQWKKNASAALRRGSLVQGILVPDDASDSEEEEQVVMKLKLYYVESRPVEAKQLESAAEFEADYPPAFRGNFTTVEVAAAERAGSTTNYFFTYKLPSETIRRSNIFELEENPVQSSLAKLFVQPQARLSNAKVLRNADQCFVAQLRLITLKTEEVVSSDSKLYFGLLQRTPTKADVTTVEEADLVVNLFRPKVSGPYRVMFLRCLRNVQTQCNLDELDDAFLRKTLRERCPTRTSASQSIDRLSIQTPFVEKPRLVQTRATQRGVDELQLDRVVLSRMQGETMKNSERGCQTMRLISKRTVSTRTDSSLFDEANMKLYLRDLKSNTGLDPAVWNSIMLDLKEIDQLDNSVQTLLSELGVTDEQCVQTVEEVVQFVDAQTSMRKPLCGDFSMQTDVDDEWIQARLRRTNAYSQTAGARARANGGPFNRLSSIKPLHIPDPSELLKLRLPSVNLNQPKSPKPVVKDLPPLSPVRTTADWEAVAEATLNYLTGQTDMLLEALSSPESLSSPSSPVHVLPPVMPSTDHNLPTLRDLKLVRNGTAAARPLNTAANRVAAVNNPVQPLTVKVDAPARGLLSTVGDRAPVLSPRVPNGGLLQRGLPTLSSSPSDTASNSSVPLSPYMVDPTALFSPASSDSFHQPDATAAIPSTTTFALSIGAFRDDQPSTSRFSNTQPTWLQPSNAVTPYEVAHSRASAARNESIHSNARPVTIGGNQSAFRRVTGSNQQ